MVHRHWRPDESKESAQLGYLCGEPKTTGLRDIFGQINGSTTVYRIWPGGIPFKKSVVFRHEHGNQNDTPANYSSVVFYYFVP
ncbi:hypothetical protein AMJ85_05505 [candidate division BRC1 bacterium SM23_51]|nr:MAG: hypothetical protein AMJ85_05505 [candidate division BRC1 bacterium SM23_51]